MKFFSLSLLALWVRLARCVSLALLPALASEALAQAQPHRAPRGQAAEPRTPLFRVRSTPYLVAMLPSPLRFLEPPPAADIVAAPAGNQFQREGEAPDASFGASDPGHANPAVPAPNEGDIAGPKADETAQPAPGTPGATPKAGPPPSAPLPILPDDTPTNLGAEDVLPFFQFPNNPAKPPAPGTLPPSSATYNLR